jgi:hypothetical protein
MEKGADDALDKRELDGMTDKMCSPPSSRTRGTRGKGNKSRPKENKQLGQPLNSALYKTEQCIQEWEGVGTCRYGPKCAYAHASEELRTVRRNQRYKTVLCENYERYGNCVYGHRCRFIHKSTEVEPPSPPPLTRDTAASLLRAQLKAAQNVTDISLTECRLFKCWQQQQQVDA